MKTKPGQPVLENVRQAGVQVAQSRLDRGVATGAHKGGGAGDGQ